MQKSCAIVLAAVLALDLNHVATALALGAEETPSSTPAGSPSRTTSTRDGTALEQRSIPKLPPAPEPSSGGIDVCFVMDCTGSMGPWIKAAKHTIKDIIARLSDQEDHQRVAFVAYRDFDDGPPQVFNFTDHIDKVVDFIDGQEAKGGGDTPEDVAGGLAAALGLSWTAETRSVVLVSDAPCHGREYAYSSERDSFPEGDPTGLSMTTLAQSFRMAHIDFTFVQLTSETEVMHRRLREAYDHTPNCSNNRRFELRDLQEILLASVRSHASRASRVAMKRDESSGSEDWSAEHEGAYLVEEMERTPIRLFAAAVAPSLLSSLESTKSGEAVPSMDVETAYKSMTSEL